MNQKRSLTRVFLSPRWGGLPDGSAFFAAVALDEEAREERDAARAARRWEKQVKMRRVLSEVGGGDRSQGVHDEESQSMLTMLKVVP